ncbi:hxnY, partial [Symbiodinium pilosum]
RACERDLLCLRGSGLHAGHRAWHLRRVAAEAHGLAAEVLRAAALCEGSSGTMPRWPCPRVLWPRRRGFGPGPGEAGQHQQISQGQEGGTGPSQLPSEEELAGFRAVLDEYASEMFRLARRLLALMALALGKPRDFFEQHLTQPVATHRLLHYWPLEDYNTEIGVGEHTDYGLLTILKQDMVGGLQVLNAKDGRWIHCCPVKNAFVINLGDMLSRWTAHRFKHDPQNLVFLKSMPVGKDIWL